MTLKSVHTQTKTHLISIYRGNPKSSLAPELANRSSKRAIELTFLHEAIRQYKFENATHSLSGREAIIHMLHETSGLNITNLNAITPSLALKILKPRFEQIDVHISPDFAEVVLNMQKWSQENAEWISRSHEAEADLPELKWSDLPSDLFGLTPDN